MRLMLYVPYLYGLGLMGVGVWVGLTQRNWRAFWPLMVLAEIARLAYVQFLISNFGNPIYAFSRGQAAFADYQGLLVCMGIMGSSTLGGGVWFLLRRRFWPGGFLSIFSGLCLLASLLLWGML
ncbi:MAG: hypothetical protein NZ958_00040 [Bacteroidia bacterium]|nr:hypothetical protein [Bacteroidia bacterium]MDW8089779.1 hypothetical protein [Bacteroidia bacterium]